jgi:hypothetical protein
MRNPASFELMEVGLSPAGAACYTYHAQNGFGGLNVEQAVIGKGFKTSGQPGFEDAWNRECAGKTLTMVTDEVEAILQAAGG